MASASAPCVRPIGFMNSSARISPIVAGLRFVINMACLTHSCDRPDIARGWVERSDTHQLHLTQIMGFAGSTHPERVFSVIASEAKQSISPRKGRMDCFVASLLAMTGAGGNSLNANSPPHTQP